MAPYTRWSEINLGDSVNLEKALTPTTRLGGHLVSGHVDGIGQVVERQEDARSIRLKVQAPTELARYIAHKGSITVEDFTLTVNAVNDAPIVSQPLADISLLEDSGAATMVLSSNFEDVDGDSLVYDVSFNSEDMLIAEVIGDTLIISTLQDKFGGPVEIMVTASDQNDAVPAVDIFDVTIEAVNDPPLIVSVPDSTAWEDIEYVYQIEVEDVDNDLFYYETAPFYPIPDGMVIDSSGSITWTPGEGVFSSGLIVLYVWDSENPHCEDSPAVQLFEIDVVPVNDPPEIISVAPPAATEDTLYTYQVEQLK
jgi:hypothetical protein